MKSIIFALVALFSAGAFAQSYSPYQQQQLQMQQQQMRQQQRYQEQQLQMQQQQMEQTAESSRMMQENTRQQIQVAGGTPPCRNTQATLVNGRARFPGAGETLAVGIEKATGQCY